MRKRPPPGPNNSPMPKALRWSQRGVRFLVSELPLYVKGRVRGRVRPSGLNTAHGPCMILPMAASTCEGLVTCCLGGMQRVFPNLRNPHMPPLTEFSSANGDPLQVRVPEPDGAGGTIGD